VSSAPDPRLGSVLRGKWRLEQLLGSGGMGSVYVASHTIGRRDAIKILRPEAARDPLIRERFRREAEAVNRFTHPGVVEIRDIDETEDGCPFLVMELLDGQSLSDRVREHGYPSLPEVLHITTQLLDVLAAAHPQGIVHRDIKPANLFLLRDGRLKVLDFGVARVQFGPQLTQLGTRLGTVAYMPPEQVRGQPIDARVDLFAVGATMFRLIGQRCVHEADDDKELVTKMATQPAPPLATVARNTPEPVCRVVDRALQFSADARYPNATTMHDDLRAVMAGYAPPFASSAAMGVAAPPVQAPPRVAPAPTQARPSAPPVPARAPWVGEQSSVLTQATAWTEFSPQQRRTRWALLAFPLLGLAVVVLAFQLVVRLGVDDEAKRSEGEAAADGAQAALPEDPAPTGQTPVEPGRTATEPPASKMVESCVEAKTCEERCIGSKCDLECRGGTCEIGLVKGAELQCKGQGLCEVWCAGACEVKCRETRCRVHCAPGERCVLEECRGVQKQCADDVRTCNASCRDTARRHDD
jgi:serine/threonine protein kinase